MTFNAGTATDYIDLLDQVIQVSTSRNLASIAVNAGGINYVAGDILSIDNTGSTRTHDAKIEVVTVAAGVITVARVYRGGAYTVDPTTTVANASTADTGIGTGATFDLTFAVTGWAQLTREEESVSAVVAAGGTGYTNGATDVLTLVGGVIAPGGAAATYTATVAGGIVTSVAQLTPGDYEVFPPNPVLTSVAPLGGIGCTLTVTKQDVAGDTIVVLQGDGGTSTDPLVGIKTYSSETDETGANTVFNWALFGMTSWSAGFALHQQPNISPGFSLLGNGAITTSTTGDGAFVPLKDSDAFNIEWWLSVTGRRAVLVAKVESASTTFYAQSSWGLLNPFGVSQELPFPAYVAGTSDRKRVWYRDTAAIWGGLSEVISRNNGPAFSWSPEGSWIEIKAASISSNQATSPTFLNVGNVAPRATVWPLGAGNVQELTNDQIWAVAGTLGFDNEDLTLSTNAIQIYRTPDTGGDLFPLYRVDYKQDDSATDFFRTFGEMDGIFWFHVADATISSEDRFEPPGSDRYLIFQNGTRIQPFSFLALKED